MSDDEMNGHNNAFDRLKAELAQAFSAPEDAYQLSDAATFITRGKARLTRRPPASSFQT